MYENLDKYSQMCPQCRSRVSYASELAAPTTCSRCKVRMITAKDLEKKPMLKMAPYGPHVLVAEVVIISRELYMEVRFRHVWWCPHCMKVLNKGNNRDKVPYCGHYMLEAHDIEQMRKQGALSLLCSTGLMKERT